MSGDEGKKAPTLDEQVAEAVKRAQQNPNIMGQAVGVMNMAYAFQFAQYATPRAEIVPMAEINGQLDRLHKSKALIISCSVILKKEPDVLITYYKMES